MVGNGELCGDVAVTAYKLGPGDTQPRAGHLSFVAQLVTDGNGDGSIPSGQLTWFYDVAKQTDGSWRLASGGSGP